MKVHKTKRVQNRQREGSATSRILGGVKKPDRIPKRWTWHYGTLLKLRDYLLRIQEDHTREVSQPLESHSLNEADSATDDFDHNMTLAAISADKSALFEIDHALMRIVKGTYGVCEESGVPIQDDRLRAIPWTRYCKEVEARLEKVGAVSPPRLGVRHSFRELERVGASADL